MKCNQKELASIFGRTTRTVAKWQEAGMPVITADAGKAGNVYDTAEVHQWLIEREITRRIKDLQGEAYADREYLDSDQELAHLRRWQARKVELETQELEGRLLDAEETMRVMLETDSKVRSAMLALPVRIAQIAMAADNRKAVEEACRKEINRALSNLAERDDQVVQEGLLCKK